MTKTQNKHEPQVDIVQNNSAPYPTPNLTFLPSLDTSEIKFKVLPSPIKSASDKKEYK